LPRLLRTTTPGIRDAGEESFALGGREPAPMSRQVVITGIGLITPVGLDRESTWGALLAGRSGIGPITRFDASPYTSRIAGEVRGFDPHAFLEKKEARKMDSFTHYAIAATREALDDAGFEIDASNAERTGVYIGSGIGGLPLLERQHRDLLDRGPRRVSPFFIPGMILNLAAGQVSILFGAKGPNLALATACATGTHAIGESYRLIREGYCDAMIAGGTEAVITPLAVGGFCAMKALSIRNDEPEKASRPFDADRDGFVMGEGAGIVVLEERCAAEARGARIYAEIVGYGISGDAYHMSAPSVDGDGAMRAMRLALEGSGMAVEEIDYINAHGTSTPAGDRVEIGAIKGIFGKHARRLVCGSTKSMTGHLLGAAGGLETAISALAVSHDRIPPTINQTNPDPECDLDCAANEAREMTVRAALNNSFGFGGTNASILLRKPV
jgi:3-oxoacyl-[acyl-carrier-protein] synthase II